MLVKVQITVHHSEGRWHQTAYTVEQQWSERSVDPREILWQLYLSSCHGVQRCEDHETKLFFPLPVRPTGFKPVFQDA